MRLKHYALTLVIIGSVLLTLGTLRGNAHTYDMYGNFTDPATGTTYSESATEMMQIPGLLMLSAGILMLVRVRVNASN